MTNNNIAIRVRNLGKKYTLAGPQEKYLTLRDAIVNSVKAPFKRFNRAPPSEEFWALKDVLPWDRRGVLVVSHNMGCLSWTLPKSGPRLFGTGN